MADIVQLLPDAVANQIAAGEVIQRPASVLKELLENAIDAGASEIKILIKDAGKTLIQVIDDGCGMSATDARMSFERHATSKIKQADDLFSIRTMGFRGEALASIAAVAQVEMKSRLHEDELGTSLKIEGSSVADQEPCQTPTGTSIAVRNLFYNVPARRKFLKSDAVEMRHLVEEFQRIALAHHDIFLSLYHNDNEIFHLPPSNKRQRIVGVFGANTNKKLVPLEEETKVVQIKGFVGKPEFAKKTRGEQYLYVNNRYIKSGYLNHAVFNAFEDLISKDQYPLYVIFLDIDPARIDVNIHPSKHEIKFDDERLIYNYLRVAVRHALGQHNITPSLDFEQEPSFSGQQGSGGGSMASPDFKRDPNVKNWENLFEGLQQPAGDSSLVIESEWPTHGEMDDEEGSFSKSGKVPYQIHQAYIITQIKSGFLLIDQQAASERILFEQYMSNLKNRSGESQRILFPQTLHFSKADAAIFADLLEEINALGYEIEDFGQESFVIHGIPSDMDPDSDQESVLEGLLDFYKASGEVRQVSKERLAKGMARQWSLKKGQSLDSASMQQLIDQLFACELPTTSPFGHHCFLTFELDDLQQRFQKQS